MTDADKKTLWEAIETFGASQQVKKAVEELAELIRALAREDGQNIIEEIADVRIMLAQLEMIFDIGWEVEHEMSEKIGRLKRRIYQVDHPEMEEKFDEMMRRVKYGLAACKQNPETPETCKALMCPYDGEEDCIQHMSAEALVCIGHLENGGAEDEQG